MYYSVFGAKIKRTFAAQLNNYRITALVISISDLKNGII